MQSLLTLVEDIEQTRQPFTRAFALLLLLSCSAWPASELNGERMLAQADDDDHLPLYHSGHRIKTFAMSGHLSDGQ